MDYTQNPFLKDDNVYYSEVEDIKDDVNALASEISQINITLTDDIKNVDERLNAYQNSIKQNVFTNKLNANVANINTAYINDINAKNVRTNVLDVNVLNVASINNTVLANPHIENMDAVNGQILKAEIKDSVIVNGSGSFDNINTNTINIKSGSISEVNIYRSTLTNVVIEGYDLSIPKHFYGTSASFNYAGFENIYGINAKFDYIKRVNTDDVRTTNIIVNGDARFQYLNASSANIGNIINTNISNATLYSPKIKGGLVLPDGLIVNDINANTAKVEDLNATTISVQELTDVNLIHANNVSSDWGYIQNLGVHNLGVNSLTLDVSKEPRETPYVLGYDANGNIFPAIAQGGGGGGSVSLPADADYIYTDTQGLPIKGIVATDLSDTNALVKAGLVATLSDQTNEQINTLTNQLNEITDMLSILNEFKPNITADYFNSASPLDYKSITAFEKGKANRSDKANYTIVADGILGFTGIKVDNNTLHFDSTLNNFYLNKDLSYMFNGCSNFDGTGFDAIPEGTTNTAYMFADTALKKPYKLPASVIDSNNMYKNITFETTPGEDIDGIDGAVFKINNTFNTNVINSNVTLYSENTNVNDLSFSAINSSIGFSNNVNGDGIFGLNFNNGNFYFEDVYVKSFGTINNANVTIKGDFEKRSGARNVQLTNCEINAENINGWRFTSIDMQYGNVYIGENTPTNYMFAYSHSPLPNIIYPPYRTNWAGIYEQASSVNMAFLNEILPNATNVDKMFYFYHGDINMSNIINTLNKNITSLYGFQAGFNAVYNTLADLIAVFPNVKNIGVANLVKSDSIVTEDEVAGFTDISGLNAILPDGTTTFNAQTLTTLEDTFSLSITNVNIVISNKCTIAPNIFSDYGNRFLTGDLNGIKNGYYLYHYARQWHGYPKNLETAQYMYANATFNEIGEPLPAGLIKTDHMFDNCYNLTSIPGVMDLSNCINAYYMFDNCYNLTNVDYNFLKTLKPGADISYMFSNCNNLVCNDFNVFTYIPEGVSAYGWFGGKLVSDVNTNNESIISTLSGLNVDGNVDIQTSINGLTLSAINGKSLNVNIDLASSNESSYYYNLSSSTINFKMSANPMQGGKVILSYCGPNSYFEVNGVGNILFTGGQMSGAPSSHFVFTNVGNVTLNGNTRYYGPYLELYSSIIELNNVAYLDLENLGDIGNVHFNQMPTHGFRFRNIIVDNAASIDTLDRSSYLSNVSFIDNRLNINTLANTLSISTVKNVTDIYLNSVAPNGKFSGSTSNIIIHIPTNATLATGLNNGTYGRFPNENIIQY